MFSSLNIGAPMALCLLSLAGAAAADDHLRLHSSKPATGASLDRPPFDIEITFSRPLKLLGHELQVLGPDGTVEATGRPAAVDGFKTLHTPLLLPLQPGVHTVRWFVLPEEGGTMSGSFSFSVVSGYRH